MNSHKNARLTFEGRKLLVDRIATQGLMPAAAAAGISERTARKWLARFRAQGEPGLLDRTSRPHRLRCAMDEPCKAQAVALRRQKMPVGAIARQLACAQATVSRLLARLGLSRLRDLQPPAPPPQRYEHAAPGDLLHLDTKKLGRIQGVGHRIHGDRTRRSRGIGWECAHVAIDDHSRAGFVQMHADERKDSAVAFLQAAVAHYAAHGVQIRRLLTDNGSAYRSQLFARTCQALGIEHRFTRPYRPQTNGKAERFIQTCLREWAYGRTWLSSEQRTDWLPAFLDYYNYRRPHSALGMQPPASRLTLNNLLIHNT
jgi:transposase InsO family protein